MRRVVFVAAACLFGVVALFALQHPVGDSSGPPMDLVVRHGRVLDGTGNTWRRAHLS